MSKTTSMMLALAATFSFGIGSAMAQTAPKVQSPSDVQAAHSGVMPSPDKAAETKAGQSTPATAPSGSGDGK